MMNRSLVHELCAIGVTLVMAGAFQPAGALTIIATFNSGATDQYYDVHGVNRTAELEPIMDCAAAFWEDIILDDHTLVIDYYWDDIAATGVNDPLVYDSNDRVINCRIRVDTVFGVAGGGTAPHNFYFDPSPGDNVEYAMEPTMYHGLPGATQAAWFNGAPPDGLEVSYDGAPAASAGPEVDGTDMLTLLLHEIGHSLGIGGHTWETETQDGDYDFNPAWIGGAAAAVECDDPVHNRIHIIPDQALMYKAIYGQVRRLPGTADILAQAAASGWTQLDIPRRHFLQGTDYNAAGNWILGEMPDSDDDVYVCAPGSGTVTMSADASARSLYVGEEASLNTGPHRLDVSETITLGAGHFDLATLATGAGGWVVAPYLLLRSGTVETDGGVIDIQHTLQCWDPDGGPGTLRAANNGLLRADILSLGGPGYDVTLDTAGGGVRVNQLSNPQDTVEMAGAFEFGHTLGSYGSRQHTVSTGQVLTVGRWFAVGHDAEATVTVSGGGRIESGRLDIGVYDVLGRVVIQGLNSQWKNTGDVTVGQWGTGEVSISDEGFLDCEDAYLGLEAIGEGETTVSGAYSYFRCSAGMHVGFHGIGKLMISNGGTVRNAHGVIGYWADGYGEVTVGGSDSAWNNDTSLYVGGRPTAPGGTGILNVDSGGTVDIAYTLKIWGPGSVDITGVGALLIADQVDVDVSAGASLTVGTDGTLRTNALTGLGASALLAGNLQIGHQGGCGQGELTILAGQTLTVAEELDIGLDAPGSVTVPGGGVLQTGTAGGTCYVGRNLGSEGTVRVEGPGATWDHGGGLQLGFDGNSTLTVSSGGRVTTGWANLARHADVTTMATVSGEGSDWTSTGGTFYIGHTGFGALTVQEGGSVRGEVSHIGEIAVGTGILTVQDPGSMAVFTGDFHVGHGGRGYLDVSGGGELTTPTTTIGDQPAGHGSAVVRGDQSVWVNTGGLQVARYGTADLTIHSQGRLETAWVNLGRNLDSNGVAIVEDAGSLWTSTGTFHVGFDGNASLTVRDGGELQTTGGCIARNVGAVGLAIVEGPGARWVSSDSLWVGGSESAAGGTGELTVRDDGELDVTGGLCLRSGGTLTFTGGRIRTDVLAMSYGPGWELHWTGGTLCVGSVWGDLDNNGGRLAPGEPVGMTDIHGTYAQSPQGKLQIDIRGSDNSDPLAPEYDTVHASNGVVLAGTLELNWLPVAGDPSSKFGGPYDVLTYAAQFGGGFDAFGGTIGGNYIESVDYMASLGGGTFAVRVMLHDLLDGDCDLDGDVDYDDLLVLKSNFGATDADWFSADFTFDGCVDASDYITLKRSIMHGKSAGMIPEPATLALLFAGGICLWPTRGRRRR